MIMNLVARDEVVKTIPPSIDQEHKDDTPSELEYSPNASEAHEKGVVKMGVFQTVKKTLALDVYFYLASGVSLLVVAVLGLWFTLGHSKVIDKQVLSGKATHSVLQKMLEDLHASHMAYVEAAAEKSTELVDIDVNDNGAPDGKGTGEIVQELKEQRQEEPPVKQSILQNRIDTLSQQIALLSQDNYELREALHFGALESNRTDEKLGSVEKVLPAKAEQESALSSTDITALIHSAYSAFNNQQIPKAGALYQQALQVSPQNRDANLGVAAIAVLQGNSILAIDRYRHLLRLDPVDRDAFAALLELSEENGSLEVEMTGHIAKHKPESQSLYGVLGSYYSRNAKWDQAVRAFEMSSDAIGLANDYFNLAVSLDHAGHQQRALVYYQEVLDRTLAGDTVAPIFSVQEVHDRVAEISGRKISGSQNP